MAVCLIVAPCSLVVYRRFGGTYCLHYQGDEWLLSMPRSSKWSLPLRLYNRNFVCRMWNGFIWFKIVKVGIIVVFLWTLINFHAPQKAGNFLASWANISFAEKHSAPWNFPQFFLVYRVSYVTPAWFKFGSVAGFYLVFIYFVFWFDFLWMVWLIKWRGGK
jgi:hypothetical protein